MAVMPAVGVGAAGAGIPGLSIPRQRSAVGIVLEEGSGGSTAAAVQADAVTAAVAGGGVSSGDGADRAKDGDKTAVAEADLEAMQAEAAAAEELAAAESPSLTQGAMKLVYLLAIQVRGMSEPGGAGIE